MQLIFGGINLDYFLVKFKFSSHIFFQICVAFSDWIITTHIRSKYPSKPQTHIITIHSSFVIRSGVFLLTAALIGPNDDVSRNLTNQPVCFSTHRDAWTAVYRNPLTAHFFYVKGLYGSFLCKLFSFLVCSWRMFCVDKRNGQEIVKETAHILTNTLLENNKKTIIINVIQPHTKLFTQIHRILFHKLIHISILC